ncbi:MAG: ECF transporter S component [bacterium]|jgi:niacin transporter
MRTRELVYGALLTAFSLVIPLAFGGYLRVIIPPFTATLASHVPVMLSMLFSPLVAFLVGVGSTIGFLIVAGPVVAARAAVHIIIGVLGALLIRQGRPYRFALLVTAPVHALGEAFIVLPFGFDLFHGLYVVGVGTLLHHGIDALIALLLVGTLHLSLGLGR